MRSKKTTVNSFYLPQLDILRFIAFILVFSTHFLNRIKIPVDTNSVFYFPYSVLLNGGWIGVDLFFVLSGFLITYILINEKNTYGRFSIKNFYIRRMLRIWPLYFLALFTAFMAVPLLSNFLLGAVYFTGENLFDLKLHLPFFISFLGNWSLIFYGVPDFRNIAHLWTISVEEQFYLFWPLLLLWCKNSRQLIFSFIILIIFASVIRFLLVSQNITQAAIYMNTFARFDSFVIGGIITLIYTYKKDLLQKSQLLFHPILFITLTIPLSLYLDHSNLLSTKSPFEAVFGYLSVSLFMGYLLLTVLRIAQIGITQNRFYKTLIWLGTISYGLYIWHRLATDITIILFGTKIHWTFIFIMAFGITIIMAGLSFYLWEYQFLKLKKRFSTLKTKSY